MSYLHSSLEKTLVHALLFYVQSVFTIHQCHLKLKSYHGTFTSSRCSVHYWSVWHACFIGCTNLAQPDSRTCKHKDENCLHEPAIANTCCKSARLLDSSYYMLWATLVLNIIMMLAWPMKQLQIQANSWVWLNSYAALLFIRKTSLEVLVELKQHFTVRYVALDFLYLILSLTLLTVS